MISNEGGHSSDTTGRRRSMLSVGQFGLPFLKRSAVADVLVKEMESAVTDRYKVMCFFSPTRTVHVPPVTQCMFPDAVDWRPRRPRFFCSSSEGAEQARREAGGHQEDRSQ